MTFFSSALLRPPLLLLLVALRATDASSSPSLSPPSDVTASFLSLLDAEGAASRRPTPRSLSYRSRSRRSYSVSSRYNRYATLYYRAYGTGYGYTANKNNIVPRKCDDTTRKGTDPFDRVCPLCSLYASKTAFAPNLVESASSGANEAVWTPTPGMAAGAGMYDDLGKKCLCVRSVGGSWSADGQLGCRGSCVVQTQYTETSAGVVYDEWCTDSPAPGSTAGSFPTNVVVVAVLLPLLICLSYGCKMWKRSSRSHTSVGIVEQQPVAQGVVQPPQQQQQQQQQQPQVCAGGQQQQPPMGVVMAQRPPVVMAVLQPAGQLLLPGGQPIPLAIPYSTVGQYSPMQQQHVQAQQQMQPHAMPVPSIMGGQGLGQGQGGMMQASPVAVVVATQPAMAQQGVQETAPSAALEFSHG